MDINKICNDKELYEELMIAYAMVGNRRARVSFRLAILNMPDTHVWDECIWNDAFEYATLVDAISGFISEDWRV